MATLDKNRAIALFWLAVTFWVHLFYRLKKRLLRKPGDPTELDVFTSNYRADGIWHVPAGDRPLLANLGECVTCRLCDPVCPSRHAEAGQGFVGPSRLVMSNERLMPSVSTWIDPFLCIRCRACDDACPQGVEIDRLVGFMRKAVAREVPDLVPAELRAAVDRVRASGHLSGTAPAAPRRDEGAHDFTYVPSCACAAADVAAETALLERAGIDFGSAPARCCGGFPASALGAPAQGGLADALAASRALNVVTGDARCYAFMKADPLYKDVVVRHVLELAGELRGGGEPEDAQRVTYHDPCQLARAPGGVEMPREAIRRAGGELVEMRLHGRAAPCCGMGGGTHTFNPALAEELGRARVRDAVASGAKVLLTQSPLCRDHLARCAGLEKAALDVKNVTEFMSGRAQKSPAPAQKAAPAKPAGKAPGSSGRLAAQAQGQAQPPAPAQGSQLPPATPAAATGEPLRDSDAKRKAKAAEAPASGGDAPTAPRAEGPEPAPKPGKPA